MCSVKDDSNQVVRPLSQNARMGCAEEGRAHTHAATALGMLLQTWDSILQGCHPQPPACCRSKLFLKAQRELAFCKARDNPKTLLVPHFLLCGGQGSPMPRDYWNAVIHVLCNLPLKRHHPSTACRNQRHTGTDWRCCILLCARYWPSMAWDKAFCGAPSGQSLSLQWVFSDFYQLT